MGKIGEEGSGRVNGEDAPVKEGRVSDVPVDDGQHGRGLKTRVILIPSSKGVRLGKPRDCVCVCVSIMANTLRWRRHYRGSPQ